MEVCGSHTNASGRYGIKKLLPDNIRLVSGPGCPVCVTSVRDIDIALHLASMEGVIFATFGDMLRVPGTRGNSLQQKRADGADVRIVASAIDCIPLADENPDCEIIFMGIGFETTSPTVASVIETVHQRSIPNFSILSVHKLVPPAIRILLDDPQLNINGFLCPGHVSIVIGASAYDEIAQKNRAAVITGFAPVDILEGLYMILGQLQQNETKVEIQYRRAVKPQGNIRARQVLGRVFQTVDAEWRGLGTIPVSGLALRPEYYQFDALRKFTLPDIHSQDVPGCRCGSILKGIISPKECALFRKTCTPRTPVGPCMVSGEGTCAAYYKYR
jgi:hydrogenase expression/formation protein HypD